MPTNPSKATASTSAVTISRRKLVVIISAAAAALVAAAVAITLVVTSGNDTKTPAAAAGGKSGHCTWAATGNGVKNVTAPPTNVPTSGKVTVHLTTSQGPMTFTLDRAEAPCTVASFVSLTQQKYFDDSPCHRVTTAGIWVLQCGDPSGYGTGNPGYFIPDEATGSETYPAGTIAMARTPQPGSGGSQFFIVYKDSPNLVRGLGTLQYTVFGRVTSGLDVVKKIGAKGALTGADGRPKLPMQFQVVTTG